jgi:hypothetical protein
LPLDQFDVTFLPGQTPRLVETRHDPGEADRWTLHAFDPGYDCKAALAVADAHRQVKFWDWAPEALLSRT